MNHLTAATAYAPGNLDEVDSEHLSGSLKSRLRNAVAGYKARPHPWLMLVLGAD